MNEEEKRKARAVFLNRQPTLWRHNCSGVTIIPCEEDEDETIKVSPLTLEPQNMDFDGDTAAIYCIHSEQGLEELNGAAHISNTITYDSNNSMLAVVRHESLYSAYVLSDTKPDLENYTPEYINSLSELEENPDLWNDHLNKPYIVNNSQKPYSYGICLLNKWLGFNDVQFNYQIDKKKSSDLSCLLYENSKNNQDYYDKLNEFNKNLLFFISVTKYSPSIDIDNMINLVEDEDEELFKKLPNNNIFIGYLINEALIDRCIEKAEGNSDLIKLYKSGSRFNKQQLARIAINIGYTADAENIIESKPIKTNLLRGLTREDFFLSSPGSRKGKLCNAL
ncbi:MAG: hypothetical protein ACOC22_02545 [bacterium]